MRNSTIEIIATSYMVQNRTLDLLERNGYTHENFSGDSRAIIEFLETHEREYGEVPEESTVLYKFGDQYSRTVVSESPLYIEDELRAHVSYQQLHKVIEQNQNKLSGSPKDFDEAVEAITRTIAEEQNRKKARTTGTDITKNDERLEEYAKKLRGEGEPVYQTNIDILDKALGGVHADDLFVVYARPGVGKSYTLTYLANEFHKQGLNILFFSGEMEASQVGYRFDSMRAHVSNGALMAGRPFPEGGTSYTSYAEYIEEMKSLPNYFSVVTPKDDFNGNLPTPKDLQLLVDDMKPDIIMIDQLSLMKDSDKAYNIREQYINIVRDLRVMASNNRTPVFVASQANRQATSKNEEGEYEIPLLEHLAESDAVGQFATRILGIASKRTEDRNIQILKMGLKKNRHGFLDEFELMVDFDLGEIEELAPTNDFEMMDKEVPF